MSNSYETSRSVQDAPPPPPKSGCGCWVWGCLSLVLVVVVGGGVVGWFGYRFVGNQIQHYTSETPQVLPIVEYDEETMVVLETRFEDFRTKLKDGEPTDDLVLTADDINAMISNNKDLKGKAFVRIEEGQIKGDVTIPTDGIPLAGGRFLNASATFDVSMDNGVLIVNLADAEVKGEKVPEQFLNAMRQENLAKNLYDDVETAKTFRRIESVVVEEGKVVLKVRKESDVKPIAADEVPADDTAADKGAADNVPAAPFPADQPADRPSSGEPGAAVGGGNAAIDQ